MKHSSWRTFTLPGELSGGDFLWDFLGKEWVAGIFGLSYNVGMQGNMRFEATGGQSHLT